MRKLINSLSFLAVGVALGANANAQIVYPYVLDFESATTSPSSKSYNSADTITANNAKWTMPGTFLGSMLSTEFRNGNNSARVRRVDDVTPNTNAILTLHTDLPLGADSFKFAVARYGSDNPSKLFVQYSTNQGATWTLVGDTINVTNAYTAPTTVSLHVGQSSPIRFRIIKANIDAARLNIDDITVTPGAQASNIVMTGFTPSGSAVHPSTNTLTLTFNEDVVAGTGNITLHEVGAGATPFAVTGANVAFAGNTVTVSGLTLNPTTSYYVQYDSAAIVGTPSGLNSIGIYDNTTWAFTTSASALQNFTEDFTNCSGTTMGVFTAYSVEGSQNWYCDNFDDTTSNFEPPYLSINGGTGSASFLNKDYLVTTLPIDITDLDIDKVNLYYTEKRRFGGDGVTRGIYYSQDFSGDAGTATWVAIDNNLEVISQTGTFVRRNKDITALIDPSQPFYLAFLYESIEDVDSGRVWQWSLDDIEFEVIEKDSNISINPLNNTGFHVAVMGMAKANEVNVRVASGVDLNNAIVTIYDVSGRNVYTSKEQFRAGTQLFQINNVMLKTGMYVLKLDTPQGIKTVKFLVE